MSLFLLFQDDADDHDCKLDLEDVLDLDTDSQRQQYAIVSISRPVKVNTVDPLSNSICYLRF